MARYLRLTIDIKVENDEFAEALLEGEATADELTHNIDSEEVWVDGYSNVEDQLVTAESTEYIVIEPNYEATTEWFARALREHAFDKGAKEPIISFIQQVRWLGTTDPEALKRVLERLDD